ncbi:MAG: hypothetical protein AAGD05_04780, partial [Bacteroidota bacterium]
NGTAKIAVVGEETDYLYQWMPDVSDSHVANNLAAGTYSVSVADPDDLTCLTVTTFAVANVDGPEASIVSTTPATCAQLNGTAVLAPVNYIYEWCNGATGFNVINLPAGNCFVTVTDPATACTNILEVMIEEVNTLLVDVEVLDRPDCGFASGGVNILVNGGSTDYTYTWSDQGEGAIREGLAAGIYSVTVLDNGATACTKSLTFTLLDDVDAIANVALANDTVQVSCIGATDGTIDFTIDLEPGFVEPLSTAIQDNMGNEYLNGELPIGNYCLQVTDGNDCLAGEACFNVRAPAPLVLDVALFNQTCDTSGRIQLTVSGGNGGYAFDWADLNGPFNPQNRMNLSVGAYDLTLTDFNGCSIVADDLAIIDECTNCPSIDTVTLALPIGSQQTYCFEPEACFNTTGLTYSLLDGSASGNSLFGAWILDGDGCLTYTANTTPGVGVDTICMVANDNGLLDTTCVVVTITSDCGLFTLDTIDLQTFDCVQGGSFCLPIALIDIGNYTIADNGQSYTGPFGDCESDTTITYFLQGLINNSPDGPYRLVSWNIDAQTFGIDTFLTISDLVDSMNLWDPSGNWSLTSENTIISNNITSNYGPLNIRSYQTNSPFTLGVNLNIDVSGTLITLDTGFHQIIINELATGCVDTLNIGLACVDCPRVYDGPSELLADNCNDLVPICLGIPIENISSLSITDNGTSYANGLIGCDLDSIFTYVALTFADTSNYTLDSWVVNEDTFSIANFNTIQQLIDSMNVWDPEGNWSLNISSINGGDFSNTYGNLMVAQNGINIANSAPTENFFPNGIALSLDTGFHQVIVEQTLSGCIDTFVVDIACIACLDNYYAGPDTLMATDCDTLTSICVSIDPNNLVNYTITDNGELYSNGFLGCDLDSIYTYSVSALNQPGNYTLNSWQVNNVFFSMGNFVSIQELLDSMNVWDPAGDWEQVGVSLVGGDFNNTYGSLVASQFGIELVNSEPTLNLRPRGTQLALDTGFHELILMDSIAGCVDTFALHILCDDFSPLPTDTIPLELLLSFTDTFCIDTTVLPGIIDTIFNICESESGDFLEFGVLETEYCIEYTALDIGTEPACIVICDDQARCDTTVLQVRVIPPTVDTVMQELVFGEADQYCIDTTELAGTIDTLFNICPENSGTNIDFDLDQQALCVRFTGVGLGDDQACLVICDAFGFCDTTILMVRNLMNLGEGPIAVDDDTTTVVNVPIVIDILANDTLNGPFIGTELLEDPQNGVAVLNTDFSFTYAPNRDTCEIQDSFTYVLTTATGTDTATVRIAVYCDELTIFSGFSPNEDGVNDVFTIRGIERFPNNS